MSELSLSGAFIHSFQIQMGNKNRGTFVVISSVVEMYLIVRESAGTLQEGYNLLVSIIDGIRFIVEAFVTDNFINIKGKLKRLMDRPQSMISCTVDMQEIGVKLLLAPNDKFFIFNETKKRVTSNKEIRFSLHTDKMKIDSSKGQNVIVSGGVEWGFAVNNTCQSQLNATCTANAFVPVIPHRRLSVIDEHSLLTCTASKSKPVSSNCQMARPQKKDKLIGKKQKQKRRKKRRKKNKRKKQENIRGYEPNAASRGRGNIQISKEMIQKTIPNAINEQYANLHSFIDKCTAINHGLQQKTFNTDDGSIKIVNYGFHQKVSNKKLYCIILQQENCGNEWRLHRLMTDVQIREEYKINFNNSDLCAVSSKMDEILTPKHINHLIETAAWQFDDIIGVFGKENGKRSMTLSLERTEFISQCKQSVGDKFNFVPIVMFKGDTYVIDFVWIIEVDNGNQNIGISFGYNEQNDVMITGIHCDGDCLLEQHQLICHAKYKCDCFGDDVFISSITHLNVYVHTDKCETLRKRIQELEDNADL